MEVRSFAPGKIWSAFYDREISALGRESHEGLLMRLQMLVAGQCLLFGPALVAKKSPSGFTWLGAGSELNSVRQVKAKISSCLRGKAAGSFTNFVVLG